MTGEAELIARTAQPATVSSMVSDLRALGVRPGMVVMVHSSLSRLGWVVGGARAVVTALLDAVGSEGTVMMPTHSSELSDPAGWRNPPVPDHWWRPIRDGMPAYDPVLTPTSHMGAIVECFRHVPGVRRSSHPTVSAAAVGPAALRLTEGHALDDGLGELSPQARLYEVDGHVLLLGVTHGNNTSLHLAERRAAPAGAATIVKSSPVLVDGKRQWISYSDLDDDDGDFDQIGDAFERTGLQNRCDVGAGSALLMRSRDVVDFATSWLTINRNWRFQ